ncbi:MAG: dUTP diphosphatase [Lachnospiraceae bacterium]|nr:dUTP diphosphatase [Lachnospiraceae bacterium]
MVEVKVINKSLYPLPNYETMGSAGMDVHANITEPITLGSLERKLIPTGLFVKIPDGYEIQVRPRSGLALKHGISLCNAIGTIDSDYTLEMGVILVNLSKEDFTINPGDRIAQIVLKKYEQIEWVEVDELPKTDRNGGFGHTGVN